MDEAQCALEIEEQHLYNSMARPGRAAKQQNEQLSSQSNNYYSFYLAIGKNLI